MRYALDALARRKGRTALTALGIGLATSLVVILLSVSAGVQASSATLAAASGVDLLATSANTSLSDGSFPPILGAHGLSARAHAVDPNVATASPWLVSDLIFANASLYAASNASRSGSSIPAGWAPAGSGAVGWIPGDNGGLETPDILAGPGFSTPQDDHFANGSYDGPATHEVVLDGGLATILKVGVGSVVYASSASPAGPADLPGWFGNATALRVVGISGPYWLVPSALLGFLYLSELQTLLGDGPGAGDPASLLLIHLTDPTNPGADQSALEAGLPHVTVFTVGQILGAVASAVNIYRTFGTIVGAIGIVVATLFATTVLLMSVDDRSREIAVLRAVGYSRRAIGQFVVEEALLLSFLGFAIGLPIGLAGAIGLNDFLESIVAGLPTSFSFISIDPAVILSGLAEVVAIGLVAAVLPAARAVSLPVAAELRAP